VLSEDRDLPRRRRGPSSTEGRGLGPARFRVADYFHVGETFFLLSSLSSPRVALPLPPPLRLVVAFSRAQLLDFTAPSPTGPLASTPGRHSLSISLLIPVPIPIPSFTMAATLRQRMPVDKVSDAPVSASSSDSGDDLTYGDFPPFTPPMFTMKDILGAIPAHCFERSALRSGAYVVADFAMVGALMYAASFIEPALGSQGTALNGWAGLAAKWAAWSTYWVFAGWVYTGIWICGESPHAPTKKKSAWH
jgi:hypothetical protein